MMAVMPEEREGVERVSMKVHVCDRHGVLTLSPGCTCMSGESEGTVRLIEVIPLSAIEKLAGWLEDQKADFGPYDEGARDVVDALIDRLRSLIDTEGSE